MNLTSIDDMSMERKVIQEIMEKKKTAEYLVVCMYESMGNTQISSDICKSQNAPPTVEDVNRMLEDLKKVKMAENVVILNWLLLSDSGKDERC